MELAFIELLRGIATHPAARGLADDAAVLRFADTNLVLSHDMIVEGVHFLPDDPPQDVAWKAVAVNLSDLAAKGARPLGVLLGYGLSDDAWDRAFTDGLRAVLARYDVPLLGGDTVSLPAGAPRAIGVTALGRGGEAVPSRSGAGAGELLFVTGTIGDAGAGLAQLRNGAADPYLATRYRRPEPRLAAGRALAPLVSAMMDVSDGLLIDASRIAAASGCGIAVALDAVPLSDALIAAAGDDRDARLQAATAGDDYELLFTAPPHREPAIRAAAHAGEVAATCIGAVTAEPGLHLRWHEQALPLPRRLGYLHGT